MLSIPIDHSQNHDRFSHEELLSSQGSDESLGVLAHVDEGANTTIELREFDNQTLLEDVKQTKKPSSCFKKFIITGIAISAIDLTASSINPLPFVNNNTFGKLKTNNQGLALLSSMTQSNLVGEIIYGPWESVHSTKQQILVIGSQSLAALVFDLIASQKLGMSSSISLTISWNLICRMLSYKLYNKLTYQPLEEKTVVPVNKKTRFAMNAVVIATNDIAAACLVNTMGQNQQMISIATLFYGTISSRFTTMLYSEVNQSEYKHRKIWIPIIRISSLFAAHGIVSTLLSETTIDTFTNPLVTVGAGSSLLLASRIFLSRSINPNRILQLFNSEAKSTGRIRASLPSMLQRYSP